MLSVIVHHYKKLQFILLKLNLKNVYSRDVNMHDITDSGIDKYCLKN